MSDATKTCTRCGEEKPLSEFHKRVTNPDGKDNKCKLCKTSPPDGLDIEEFIGLTHEMTNDELAEHYGYNSITVAQWKTSLRKHGYRPGTINTFRGNTFKKRLDFKAPEPEFPEVEPAGFVENNSEEYVKYELLNRDRLLVFGDWHVPYHDTRVLDMAFRIAERFGIRSGILNGDIVDNDVFSPFPATQADPHNYFAGELQPTAEMFKVFLRVFDDLLWLEANHERRLNRAVAGHFSVWQLMERILGMKYSQYSYAYVESGGEEILVTHPKNFRKKPGSLPLEMATNHLMNVICGHVHRLCFQFHPSGRYWAVEGGHCADAKKIHYKMRDIDLYGVWNSGFIMVIDGWPHIIEPRTWDVFMKPFADIEKPRREGPTEEELVEIEKHKQAIKEFEAKHGAH